MERNKRSYETKQKAALIAAIIAHMRHHATNPRDGQRRAFDDGDAFFALAFKSEVELQRIVKMIGC